MKHIINIKPSTLTGKTVSISGYRHSANLIIAAIAALPLKKVTLNNVPFLEDINTMLHIFSELGGIYQWIDRTTLELRSDSIINHNVPSYLSQQIHSSLYYFPALVSRFSVATIGQTGGCQIGSQSLGFSRPFWHIASILKQSGCEIQKQHIDCKAIRRKLNNHYYFDIMNYSDHDNCLLGPHTSGATKTAILGCLHADKIQIDHPFLRTEVLDLLSFLEQVGYQVKFNDEYIEIVNLAQNHIVNYQLSADPSEVVTFCALAKYHQTNLVLHNIDDRVFNQLQPDLYMLSNIGMHLTKHEDRLEAISESIYRPQYMTFTPQELMTDHHPFYAILLHKAKSMSRIRELVWYERFGYINELRKFGLNYYYRSGAINIIPARAQAYHGILNGVDLRATVALMILATGIDAETKIDGYHHICRGYVDLIDKLQSLGIEASVVSRECITP